MRERRRVLGSGVGVHLVCLVCLIGAPGCGSTEPVKVLMAYCEPQQLEGSFTQGYAGPGYGHDVGERRTVMRFQLQTSSPGDDPADALAATNVIDVCVRAPSFDVPGTGLEGQALCGGAPYGFDLSMIDDPAVQIGTTAPGPTLTFEAEVPWGDGGYGPGDGLFLRVTPVGTFPSSVEGDWQATVAESGMCQSYELAAETSKMKVYAVRSHPETWGGLDNCTDGVKAVGFGKRVTDACLDQSYPGQSATAAHVLDRIDDAQERHQLQMPLDVAVRSWVNGTDGADELPLYVLLGPRTGYASSPGGALRLTPTGLNDLDPAAPVSVIGGEYVRIMTHEHLHKLEQAWSRELPVADALKSPPLVEEPFAVAVSLGTCTFDYPTLPSDQCASAGKLGVRFEGHFNATSVSLPNPRANLFTPGPVDPSNYALGPFWAYVLEQFSYPVPTSAHPSGPPSLLPRPGDGLVATGSRPFSDDGFDLLGLLYQGLGEATVAGLPVTNVEVFDGVTTASLGRPLRDLVLDYRTALFLKDYNDAGDPRWRLDWVGDFNDPDPLDAQKPFGVPVDLYGLGPDGLTRARRALDPFGTCGAPAPGKLYPTCAAYPGGFVDTLEVGEAQATGPITLDAFGAAAFGVVPGVGLGGVTVAFDTISASKPRVRVFRLEQGANGAVIPEAVCGMAPAKECTWLAAADGSDKLVVSVPTTLMTREVLVVAAAMEAPSSFEAVFNPGGASLELVEPTTSLKAFVGHPTGPDGKRPLLLKLHAPGQALTPAAVSAVRLEVSQAGSTLCQLTGDTDPGTSDPFVVTPLVGGNLWALVTLDDACYPLTGSNVELDVTVRSFDLSGAELASDTQPAALVSSSAPRTQATVVVADASDAMSFPSDAPEVAMKVVSKAVVDALVPLGASSPTETLAVVQFRGAGTTVQGLTPVSAASAQGLRDAIDGITPSGSPTAIGSGLLHAQHVLAQAYDAGVLPDAQSVVLISRGKNDTPNSISDYLFGPVTPQPDWVVSPLMRLDRVSAKLALPRISTVAVGQGAELGALQQLALHGGGSFVLVPASIGTSPSAASADLADSVFQALADAGGFDRIVAKQAKGLSAAAIDVPVEAAATELRVVVVSATEDTRRLALKPPMGPNVAPVSTRREATVFRVRAPEAGLWRLVGGGPATSDASVLVEASVKSAARVVSVVDVPYRSAYPAGYEGPGHGAGDPVTLLVMAHEGGPLRHCTARAAVESPTGRRLDVDLVDDGEHGDGAADDGVYGAVVRQTSEPGRYDVRLGIRCTSTSGGPPIVGEIVREARRTLVLLELDDADGDGLPDRWEARFGLDPLDARDAMDDADDDGLTNLDERELGTDPTQSDTDGGGEDDASELAAGTDPHLRRDDAVRPPIPWLTPADGAVRVGFGMLTLGATLEVERAPRREGPWGVVGVGVGQGAASFDDAGLQNGTSLCYRLRATRDDGRRTGWSFPACGRVAPDPFAPHVAFWQAFAYPELRAVRFVVGLSDEPARGGEPHPSEASSGVEAVRFSTTMSMDRAEWVELGGVGSFDDPASGVSLEWADEELLATLPPGLDHVGVWLQARDRAGNESPPQLVHHGLRSAR